MEKDNGGKDGEEEAGGGWQWETDDIREQKISLSGGIALEQIKIKGR